MNGGGGGENGGAGGEGKGASIGGKGGGGNIGASQLLKPSRAAGVACERIRLLYSPKQ